MLLKESFSTIPNTEFNTQMIEMIALEDKTLKLLDNDFNLSVWAYLLPTYRIHTQIDEPNKTTIERVRMLKLKASLGCSELKADAWNTRISRARNAINNVLPKGTILVTKPDGDDLLLMFMSAHTLDEAHKLVTQHFEGVPTIDKLLASFGVFSV